MSRVIDSGAVSSGGFEELAGGLGPDAGPGFSFQDSIQARDAGVELADGSADDGLRILGG
jgi:hypothetical protein